jgi:hypothetical protein
MNTQLVESIAQIILSLSPAERQLLESKINHVNSTQEDISDLEQSLKNFETKYKMSSSEFYQKFQAGKLGDDIDFFEWSVFYEMRGKFNRWLSDGICRS